MTANRLAAAAAVLTSTLALTVGLTGCTRAAQAPPTDAKPAAPVAVASATAAGRTTSPPQVSTAPVRKGYDAARRQWRAGAAAVSAEQGRFWSAAAADLVDGAKTDTQPTGYALAIRALTNLISLPDAQQTPAQNAAYHADIDDLNVFFATPGLYN